VQSADGAGTPKRAGSTSLGSERRTLGALIYAGPGASTSTPLQALPPRTARLSLDFTL
jgi:hypothetical protein